MKIVRLSSLLFLSLSSILILSSCRKTREQASPVQNVQIGTEQYATAKIGNQTWTTENFRGTGGVPFDEANTRPEYGKYYSLAEMKAVVLPAGWRVPTIADFIKLGESQGVVFSDHLAKNQPASLKLISKSRWLNVAGNNESGFNAFPANYVYQNSSPIEGDIGELWTSEGYTFSLQESADKKSVRLMFYNNSSADGYKFNLRFVRD